MDTESIKNKSLTKEETKALVFLIEESKIINNKKTNATNNKIKIEEWARITTVFNATIGNCRRTPQQLRLKWENLKKSSRKRSALIRMERVKTGGGPPGYFPPDEILDKVATLLGNTGEGLTAMYGGDAEWEFSGDWCCETSDIMPSTSQIMPSTSQLMPSTSQVMPSKNQQEASKTVVPVIYLPSNSNNTSMDNGVPKNTPLNMDGFRSSGSKRKVEKPDDGRKARNIALTEYYTEKRKLLETKIENIMLENENLKLENEKLKLEISKLNNL